MRQQQTCTITDLISDFLKENNLEEGYLQRQIIDSWDTVLGPLIARYTGEKYVKDGVLYVHIKSAALRQELFGCRYQLVAKLNEAVGATAVIRDLRLLS